MDKPRAITSTVFGVRSISESSPEDRTYPEYIQINGPRRAHLFLGTSINMGGKDGVSLQGYLAHKKNATP